VNVAPLLAVTGIEFAAVAKRLKSEVYPKVAPETPETDMVHTTVCDTLAGEVFTQDNTDEAVGGMFTVNTRAPLVIVFPPTETVIEKAVLVDTGVVVKT
jgi:hypothetical protein